MPATPRLIAVGRLKAPKDFLTLIRALATLVPGSCEALMRRFTASSGTAPGRVTTASTPASATASTRRRRHSARRVIAMRMLTVA